MTESNATSEGLIPSYVLDRNAAVEKTGAEVGVRILGGEIVSTWLGSAAQLNSCGMRIQGARIFRPPAKSEWLCSPFFHAEACREGEDSFSLVMRDKLPMAFRRSGDVNEYEMRTYSEHRSKSVWYHSRPERLIELSLIQARWVPRGEIRGSKFYGHRRGRVGEEYFWEVRLCFDGTMIFEKDVISEQLRHHWRGLEVERRQRPDPTVEVDRQERQLQHAMQTRAMASARLDESFQRFLDVLSGGVGHA